MSLLMLCDKTNEQNGNDDPGGSTVLMLAKTNGLGAISVQKKCGWPASS